MRSGFLPCLAVAALAAGAIAQGTTPGQTQGTTPGPAPSGTVAGRVIDGTTGQPVAGALVTLGGGPAPPPVRSAEGVLLPVRTPQLITGGDGQFAFRGLGAGSFMVGATRSGYLAASAGSLRPGGGGQQVAIAQGDQKTDVVVRMFRSATVAGTVIDDLGEPLVGARVLVARRLPGGARPNSGFQYVATTDDRGSYRVGNLSPGEYTVGVTITQTSAPAVMGGGQPAPGTFVSADRRFVLALGGTLAAVQDGTGRLLSYAPTYYPSSRTSTQSTPVLVRPGEERLGIDLTVPLLPAATVSGTLASPDGQMGGYQLRLAPTDTGSVPVDPASAVTSTDASGAFVFLGVPSGRYVLQTERVQRLGPPTGTVPPMLWAYVPVSVGESDISGLAIATQPGLTISGRVELEGSVSTGGTRAQILFSFDPVDAGTRSSNNVGATGPLTPFTSAALIPGLYRSSWMAPGGWALKSAMWNGIDISDGPFELRDRDLTDVVVTFTDRPSTIAGNVRLSGNPDPGAMVLIFSPDTKYWASAAGLSHRFAAVRVTSKGAFGPVSLRPGDYCVIATADEFGDEWLEPRNLEVLARQATRVTLGDGQTVTVELTRAPIRGGNEQNDGQGPASSNLAYLAYQAYPAYLASVLRQVRDTRTVTPRDPGSVSGTVLEADGSNRPVARARITLRPLESRQEFATISDPAGRFTFARVPSGRYTMTVTKPAYLVSHYGTGDGVLPPGLPIAVEDGKAVSGLTLRLVHGAAITGTVIDEFGQPVAGARMQVLQPFGDEKRLSPLVIQGTPLTDDRGVYRIFGLQPGSYAVATQPSTAAISVNRGDVRRASDPARPVTYASTYYPGTVMSSEASLVEVAAGRDTNGIDIGMRIVPTSRLAGTVTAVDGRPIPYVQVQLVPAPPSQVQGLMNASGHTPEDGLRSLFSISDVAPGRYTIVARAVDRRSGATTPADANALLWAQQDVDVVGEDILDMSLVLRPAVPLNGRVVFDGTTPDAISDGRELRVMLQPSGSAVLAATQSTVPIDDSGRFVFSNLVPGRYRVGASALSLVGTSPSGIWTLASAMAGGRDLLDYPLDVQAGQALPEVVLTYSNQSAELSGRLIDAAGKPMKGMSILLFGTDRAVWSRESRRVRAPILPADDGSFRFLNLPPGEYFLGVMTDVDPKQAGDPALLEQLAPAAIRIAIGPGEKKTQDIRIAGPPLAGVRGAPSARR